ncbi:hypothetical protein PR048_005172, partial [Dryococelus australis]
MYTHKIAKLPVSASFQLASIPPTILVAHLFLSQHPFLLLRNSSEILYRVTLKVVAARDGSVCGLDCSVVLCVPSAVERRALIMLSLTMVLMERTFR